jgi:cell division protein FtsW
MPALAVMIGTSFLSPRQARRVSLVVLAIALALMLAVLFVGVENNGSRRWINIGGLSIQPSEFMKPAFVVICAWLFAENSRRRDIPGNVFALILLATAAALLVAEPDFGQTMLIAVAWGALFFMAGMPWMWIAALGMAAVGGIFAAYTMLPHVAGRINRFLAPHTGDTFQVDTAMDSIMNGGWLGRGPGEGTVKRILPDAHTDFIFAVAAEEFGIIICIGLVMIFAFVVLRGLSNSQRSPDAFTRLASAGLIVLFGVQAVINMGVNLSILPAKGMTLPFISYGGSSMIAVAFGMGLILALTRRRREGERVMRTVINRDPVPDAA